MRTLSLSAAGVLAASLALFTPQTSQAQSFGIRVDTGNFGFSYFSGPTYDYGYRPAYAPSYGYSPYRDRGHDHYRDSRYSRPVIVHPDYYHWTPGRGYHSHGHLHVPHGGHYHRTPY